MAIQEQVLLPQESLPSSISQLITIGPISSKTFVGTLCGTPYTHNDEQACTEHHLMIPGYIGVTIHHRYMHGNKRRDRNVSRKGRHTHTVRYPAIAAAAVAAVTNTHSTSHAYIQHKSATTHEHS